MYFRVFNDSEWQATRRGYGSTGIYYGVALYTTARHYGFRPVPSMVPCRQ